MNRIFQPATATVAFAFFLISFCKPEVDRNIAAAYQNNAKLLCEAVTECLVKEVEQRMSDEPQRRDLITGRMDRDLCIENQFRLIGQRSTEIVPGNPATQKKLYDTFERCAEAVAAETSCESRKEVYKKNESCKAIRQEGFAE